MQKTRERRRQAQGFTLVELIVVVTILALLMGLLAPKVMERFKKSQSQIAKMQLGKVKTALDRFALDTGRYPSQEEGLNALIFVSGSVDNWGGPYLEKSDLVDPWKQPFMYRYPCQHGGQHDYDLFSKGPNQVEDPSGGDDIRSWE